MADIKEKLDELLIC